MDISNRKPEVRWGLAFEGAVLTGLFLVSVTFEHFTNLSAGLAGMSLFFVLLQLKILRPEQFSCIAPFLLMHLSFFFIPPAAKVVDAVEYLDGIVWKLVLILVLSSMFVMGVTAWVVQFFLRLEKRNV